jgi:hypothetical protein
MAYLLVGTSRHMALGGAPSRWRSGAGALDLYVPAPHFVVGTEAAVRAALAERGVAPADADAAVAHAWRAGAQGTEAFKAAVRAERGARAPSGRSAAVRSPLRAVRAFNRTLRPAAEARAFVVKLRNHRNEEKTSPCKSTLLKRAPRGEEDTTDDATTAAPLGARPRVAEAFARRVAGLRPNQVLDVSMLDAATGRGARAVPRPSERDRTRRAVEGVPIVSRRTSPLRVALRWLGEEERAAAL